MIPGNDFCTINKICISENQSINKLKYIRYTQKEKTRY